MVDSSYALAPTLAFARTHPRAILVAERAMVWRASA